MPKNPAPRKTRKSRKSPGAKKLARRRTSASHVTPLAAVRPPLPGHGKRGEKGHLGYLLRQAQAATRLTMERALAEAPALPATASGLGAAEMLKRRLRMILHGAPRPRLTTAGRLSLLALALGLLPVLAAPPPLTPACPPLPLELLSPAVPPLELLSPPVPPVPVTVISAAG